MGGKGNTSTRPKLQSKDSPEADCGAYLQERLGRIFLCSYGVANFCGRWGIFDLVAGFGIACFGDSSGKGTPKGSFPFGIFPYLGEF